MGTGIVGTLPALGLISIIFSIIYYGKNRKGEYSKKVFYSTLIGGLVLFSIGVGFTDTETQEKLDEALEQNEVLTSNINILETDKEELERSISDYEDKISDLESELEDLEKEIEKYENELASLNDQEEEIDNLKQKISELEKENEKLKNEIKKLEANASNSKATTTASTSSDSGSGTSESSSSSSSSSSNTTSAVSVASEDCNIKGSESGIYHVPGSTYYDRTKNVVQWFCSTDEAIAAGYRAPKR